MLARTSGVEDGNLGGVRGLVDRQPQLVDLGADVRLGPELVRGNLGMLVEITAALNQVGHFGLDPFNQLFAVHDGCLLC